MGFTICRGECDRNLLGGNIQSRRALGNRAGKLFLRGGGSVPDPPAASLAHRADHAALGRFVPPVCALATWPAARRDSFRNLGHMNNLCRGAEVAIQDFLRELHLLEVFCRAANVRMRVGTRP